MFSYLIIAKTEKLSSKINLMLNIFFTVNLVKNKLIKKIWDFCLAETSQSKQLKLYKCNIKPAYIVSKKLNIFLLNFFFSFYPIRKWLSQYRKKWHIFF